METASTIEKIAFVGNYLPRKCGIATFTSDLLTSVAAGHPQTQCFAVPVNDVEEGYEYPGVVRFEIEEQDVSSYQLAADFINISNVNLVCVQHEFGIFGGPAGSHLLALLRELKMPVVTTLHTVLRQPDFEQRRVMQEVIARSTRLVVMTQRAQQMLQEVYQAPRAKIDVIPHGIPDIPHVDPNYCKDQLGVEGRVVLLTFGLLSPNKGIEHVLNALPQILAEFPDVVYIVVGATHPHEWLERGEAYRLSLEILAKKNNIEKSVIFCNRFVELGELKGFIGAADLYITPYLNEAQITSGALAYAFGAGKAVVSTPYWHAAELLAEERGILVPFGDSKAIGREVAGLLRDSTRRDTIGNNAYKLGREMVWNNVARLYMSSFERARLQGAIETRKQFNTRLVDQQPPVLPEVRLGHLPRMPDSTGTFQHAILTLPNFFEGYRADDNARALIFSTLLDEMEREPARIRKLSTTYAGFLNHAFDDKTKRFQNFLIFDRNWLNEQRSKDSHARTLWALGLALGCFRHQNFEIVAGQLFAQVLPGVTEFISPCAWALSLIGISEYLRRLGGPSAVNQPPEALMAELNELIGRTGRLDRPWREENLAYDNACLERTLILSVQATGEQMMLKRWLQSYRCLAKTQNPENGRLRPIGSNGLYRRDGKRSNFDHQPFGAQAMVSACHDAYSRCVVGASENDV
jgi:glycosyltransferase involved in cell wall biosynthesis